MNKKNTMRVSTLKTILHSIAILSLIEANKGNPFISKSEVVRS